MSNVDLTEFCRECLPGIGSGLSLTMVFGLHREARFVRLSVTHKWHLLKTVPMTERNMTMCGRMWGVL